MGSKTAPDLSLSAAQVTVLDILSAFDRRREDVTEIVKAFSCGWTDKIGRFRINSLSDVVRCGLSEVAGRLIQDFFCKYFSMVLSPHDCNVLRYI